MMNDLRVAFRQLRRNPAFTVVAVLTFALGLGSSTVVISVAKGVFLRPLGLEAEEELFWMRWVDSRAGRLREDFSWREFAELQEVPGSFQQLAMVAWPGTTWTHENRAEGMTALYVTSSLLDLLRVRPVHGRGLVEADGDPSATPVVMMSYELWQSRFGGDPDVLGRTLRLDEREHEIVGILPPGLEFPLGHPPASGSGPTLFAGLHHFWLPLRVSGEDRTNRGARMFWMIGRLKSGVSPGLARGELATIGQRWRAEHPDTNQDLGLELMPLRDQVLGRTRQGIPILAGAVLAVLLVACVNVSNLLLARGVTRERELAVRRALGAGRRRLMGMQWIECSMLALPGCALGMGLAVVSVQLLRAYGPEQVPFLREVRVDWAVVACAFALALVAALIAGVFPALRHRGVRELDALRSGRRSSAGPRFVAWQKGLLIGQIAMVLVLLISAVLLLQSFRRLMGVDLGYRPESVIAMDLGNRDLPTNADGVRLYRQVHARLLEIPGIEAVGTIQSIPLTGKWTWEERADVLGQSKPVTERPHLAVTFVAFDYFQAMGIGLVAGRLFHASELRDDGYAPVAILNETGAQRLFQGENPIGRRFAISSSPERYYEVVGVVRDTRDAKLEQPPDPRFYLLYTHGGSQVLARTRVEPAQIIPRLRTALEAVGSRLVIHTIQPMREIVAGTAAERRFLLSMLSLYAVVATGIAAAGVFGVVHYQVAQRTHEFGVRLALGATRESLTRLVLGQAGRVAAVGLILGLLLSFGTSRFLVSQLFGLSPRDPASLLTASLLLLGIAILASAFPARRAARVDPIVALRAE